MLRDIAAERMACCRTRRARGAASLEHLFHPRDSEIDWMQLARSRQAHGGIQRLAGRGGGLVSALGKVACMHTTSLLQQLIAK